MFENVCHMKNKKIEEAGFSLPTSERPQKGGIYRICTRNRNNDDSTVRIEIVSKNVRVRFSEVDAHC